MQFRLMVSVAFAVVVCAAVGHASAVECAVCERRLVDCRAPAQEKFVACMNQQQSDCSLRCANECKTQRELQRCTINCVRTCQNAGDCRATFASVTNRCVNAYDICKRDCTIPVPPR
jgi:hypothetical protein